MRILRSSAIALFAFALSSGAQEAVQALHGTITKIDGTAQTISFRLVNGGEETLHYGDRTVIHGVKLTTAGARNSFYGLDINSDVVAHFAAGGNGPTIVEIDKVGKDGMDSATGTVARIDRGNRTLIIKGADGVEQVFRLTDRAAADAGPNIAEGDWSSTTVTVYYMLSSGAKVAHYFERKVGTTPAGG